MEFIKIIKAMSEVSSDAFRLEKDNKHGKRNARGVILVFFIVVLAFAINGGFIAEVEGSRMTEGISGSFGFSMNGDVPWALVLLFFVAAFGCPALLVWAERKGWI